MAEIIETTIESSIDRCTGNVASSATHRSNYRPLFHSLSNHAYRRVRQKINEGRREGGSSHDLEKAGQIEKGTSKREKGGLRGGSVETRHSIGKLVSGANQFQCIRERSAPDLQMATRNISEQVRSLTKKPFLSSLVHEEIRDVLEQNEIYRKRWLLKCICIFFLINVSFLLRYYGWNSINWMIYRV